jgi:hypothetical protein
MSGGPSKADRRRAAPGKSSDRSSRRRFITQVGDPPELQSCLNSPGDHVPDATPADFRFAAWGERPCMSKPPGRKRTQGLGSKEKLNPTPPH